ncbi:hypothetical protein Ccrd_007791 [Cynara cardunculus var. scolymus]|uniref:Uncharacterized protein n=1 Tax=Cynara cardunculus var. scolymus TaxID=59895 RepID=A0A103XGA0_CYNCS|nr:hypothetical protein Ccrd_007791 [Cynara cardunculus var. scolymus]
MCLRRSILRWPDFDANGIHIVSSYFTTGWTWTSHNLSQITTGWSTQGFRRLDIWIVDDLLWNLVMAVESLVAFDM